ncbi:MAG: hypothetical protein E7653_00155 [Ruminococcaceae bacterium]|nr:hypothetical protein [Oscillospiraceae bacterium]
MKKILIILGAIILVAATILSVCSIFNLFPRERNEANLIDITAEDYIKTHNTARGVKVKVDDNGLIKLSGKATSANSVTVATVALKAGTYTLSGVSEPNIDEFGMRIMYGNGNIAMAGTDSATFTLAADETVSIILYWCEDYNFAFNSNSTVKPVLVEGETAGEFYK